jgi:blocked-early-in-transport protein 1
MSQPNRRGIGQNNMTQRGTGSNGSYNFGSRDQRADEASRTLIEQENELRMAELGEQVSLLRNMSQEINNEVKSQNSLLDGMGSTFGSANELFKGTIGKLGELISSGGSNHMYYLIGFVIIVFLMLYFLM